ncbi:hypothetical protein GOB90_08805 [Acetobacter oeni]|nr:hypothetical protein [Acetobacter oeni]
MPAEALRVTEKERPRVFQEAMDFVEDGDYEEACDLFELLVQNFPEDRGVWWQYLSALRRARMHDKADELDEWCYQTFPDDIGFTFTWTRTFDSRANWDEGLRRRREVLSRHSAKEKPVYLPAVTECILPLVEKKDFAGLKVLLEEYWDTFFTVDNCGAAVYFALEAIGDYRRQIEMCDRLLRYCEPGNPVLHGVNYANLRVLAETALWNQEVLAGRGNKVNILSFGQSCLPYTIANRWGLTNYVGNPDAITIFDLGAFGKNTAAEALKTNFASYLDPASYHQGRDPMGAPQMFHRPTGVHFGHERGQTIIGAQQEKFFPLINKKIKAFQSAWAKGNSLLVYGIVGQCDLPAFVSEMEPLLARQHSRLLIFNLTRSPLDCPASPSVTYVHLPFPMNYSWNGIEDYTSDTGLAFDSRLTGLIRSEIDRMASTVSPSYR